MFRPWLTEPTLLDPRQKVTFYRDSQGRTRTERTFPAPPGVTAPGIAEPRIIEIVDPVNGFRYTLDPRSRTARRMSTPVTPGGPTLPSTARTAQRVSGPIANAAPPTSASVPQTQRPQFSRESLGAQTIEGVLAQGVRTIVVYPIGFVGNDRPVTTVSETWTSDELKAVVQSKNSDPRNGESTTRLINISRAEPDPSLFMVPPDYKVEVMETQPAVVPVRQQ